MCVHHKLYAHMCIYVSMYTCASITYMDTCACVESEVIRRKPNMCVSFGHFHDVQYMTPWSSAGYNLSLSTILRSRSSLGWTFRGSAYCQIIWEVNKLKRLEWAQEYTREAEVGFSNVIFTDKTSIQLEPHQQFCSKAKTQANMSTEYIHVYCWFVYNKLYM